MIQRATIPTREAIERLGCHNPPATSNAVGVVPNSIGKSRHHLRFDAAALPQRGLQPSVCPSDWAIPTRQQASPTYRCCASQSMAFLSTPGIE
jgi:hypothetical protein